VPRSCIMKYSAEAMLAIIRINAMGTMTCMNGLLSHLSVGAPLERGGSHYKGRSYVQPRQDAAAPGGLSPTRLPDRFQAHEAMFTVYRASCLILSTTSGLASVETSPGS
jgi:hypothetical protein